MTSKRRSSRTRPAIRASKSLVSIVAEKCIKGRLPFESRSELKPLKDALLESCARNFREIFAVGAGDGTQKETWKWGVRLESNLFERILEKSRDMNLIVPPECVRRLLGYRDELNWQNVELFELLRSHLDVTEASLESISSGKAPVRKLSFHTTKRITDVMLLHVSMFASTLEHLEIRAGRPEIGAMSDGELLQAEARSLYTRKIELPRLRRLKLSCSNFPGSLLGAIDVSSFSERLEVLELQGHTIYDNDDDGTCHFVDLIVSCKNLITLSLRRAHLGENEVDAFFEAIGSLRKLENLDLQSVWKSSRYDDARFDLSRIVPLLPNLKNLEVSCSQFVCSDFHLPGRGRRLKYLGALGVTDQNVWKIPADILLNDQSFESYERLLLFFENDSLQNEWFSAIARIVSSVSSRPTSQREGIRYDLIERALLRFIELKPHLTWYVVDLIKHVGMYGHLSPEFGAKVLRRHVSSDMWLRDYRVDVRLIRR